MNKIVDTVRVSSKGKEILLRLKKRTGMQHWNELCRVALCRSLSDDRPVTIMKGSLDVAIEMDWKTFAGAHQEILAALLVVRAHADGVESSNLGDYFRAHLERGLASLSRVRSLPELVRACVGEGSARPGLTPDVLDQIELPS